MNHMNTTTSQFITKVSCWTLPFVPSWALHLPSFSTLTYISPLPSKHTHTYTLHLQSYTHHSPRQWQTGGEAYKGVRDFRDRAEETSVFSKSGDQLPPTALHFLQHPPLDLQLVWVAQTLSLSLKYTLTCPTVWASCSCDCSSGPSPALLSQHAAPGGVSSSHGGSVQR